MSGIPKVTTVIQNGNLGRPAANEDGIAGFIMSGISTSGWAYEAINQLKSVQDAEALGIDAAYDTANKVLCHYHIKEFFRKNPGGELWVQLVQQTKTLTNMADPATLTYGPAILQAASGRIRLFGVIRNPATGYTATLTTGLDADVITAIAKAALLKAWSDTNNMPLATVVVEGRSFNGTTSSALDLRAATAEGVTVCIGADLAISGLDVLQHGYAAVGTMLGDMAAIKVNQSIACPDYVRIDDPLTGDFAIPGLSSNTALTAWTATDLDTLTDKGYTFPRTFVGYAGAYWNESPSCTVVTSDFAYFPELRVVNKARRNGRAALIPKLNSSILVDPTNGRIAPEVCKYFETLVYGACEQMLKDSECSGLTIFVDKVQNVLSTSKLVVQGQIVPTGTARVIEFDIAFSNPF